MRLIQLLNQLEQQGTLGQLYQADAITLAMYSHREIYNYYKALLSSSHYIDWLHKTAHATAEGCKVDVSTVYRALRIMEQQVSQAAVAVFGRPKSDHIQIILPAFNWGKSCQQLGQILPLAGTKHDIKGIAYSCPI